MITESGFSKDPNIVPEGIALTFAKIMLEEQGGFRAFLTGFKAALDREGGYWMHKLAKQPKHDVAVVYIIICNRLAYKCFYGGYHYFEGKGLSADGNVKTLNWPGVILAGPLEKCPFKRKLTGFRGFRYTTKLF